MKLDYITPMTLIVYHLGWGLRGRMYETLPLLLIILTRNLFLLQHHTQLHKKLKRAHDTKLIMSNYFINNPFR